jgi:hypothetical protein
MGEQGEEARYQQNVCGQRVPCLKFKLTKLELPPRRNP